MKLNKFEVNSHIFYYRGLEKEVVFAFGEYKDTNQLAVVLIDCEEHKALCEISINILPQGRKKLKNNFAYINVNSSDYSKDLLLELLVDKKIAKPTNKGVELEGVYYPIYCFDFNKMWDLRISKIRIKSCKENN